MSDDHVSSFDEIEGRPGLFRVACSCGHRFRPQPYASWPAAKCAHSRHVNTVDPLRATATV